MKRFSVGLVLLLLSTFSIFAQNKVITVSGRVVEVRLERAGGTGYSSIVVIAR